MANLKDFLIVKEAATYLGVSSETLRRWDNAKKLKSYRHPINKYRLYKKADLEIFLKKIKKSR
ncbi:MAG: MerR family transcriptional regulator [Omnitrophica bacterium GWA2_52_12]|nr:MAG: MerR family transcriptional regulator [Omnitrophica bacterium GWA2_52_12]